MTDDEADLALLQMANENRKFAISVDYTFEPDMQRAFDRGCVNGWFTLLDVAIIPRLGTTAPLMVYRLTKAGLARLAEAARAAGGKPQ